MIVFGCFHAGESAVFDILQKRLNGQGFPCRILCLGQTAVQYFSNLDDSKKIIPEFAQRIENKDWGIRLANKEYDPVVKTLKEIKADVFIVGTVSNIQADLAGLMKTQTRAKVVAYFDTLSNVESMNPSFREAQQETSPIHELWVPFPNMVEKLSSHNDNVPIIAVGQPSLDGWASELPVGQNEETKKRLLEHYKVTFDEFGHVNGKEVILWVGGYCNVQDGQIKPNDPYRQSLENLLKWTKNSNFFYLVAVHPSQKGTFEEQMFRSCLSEASYAVIQSKRASPDTGVSTQEMLSLPHDILLSGMNSTVHGQALFLPKGLVLPMMLVTGSADDAEHRTDLPKDHFGREAGLIQTLTPSTYENALKTPHQRKSQKEIMKDLGLTNASNNTDTMLSRVILLHEAAQAEVKVNAATVIQGFFRQNIQTRNKGLQEETPLLVSKR